ncbi:MAG: dynamin family protein, partial [Acidobacteriia bacterium]|nr:dynamin family protein [Terriglobia bacterium]
MSWFERHVAPLAVRSYPKQMAQWRKQLAEIQAMLKSPTQVRIALVGTTGAGKSTFLNAVLGQEVLPVGVMAPCTAFVTAVRHATGPGYKVQVQFVTPDEWRKDLDTIVATLGPGETDEEGTDKVESKRFRDAARKRIAAVYRLASDDGFDAETLLATPLPAEVQAVFDAGSRQSDAFADPKEMLAYLRKLVRGDSPLWPLIKQVELSGPYECLSGGIELVDLPGLNDPNEARVDVTRGFLHKSIFVWVVFSMVRGLTEDIQRVLREEKVLRTLVLTGSYHALSLVGTKADEIDMNLADQLGLSEDCSIPELVARYRTQTVKQARQQLVEMVRELTAEREDDETAKRMLEMARRVRVHATSANAYMRLEGIGRLRKEYGLTDAKETGIPEVHDHLRQIGRDAGLFSNARVAYQRLRQLRDEIAFFFRARTQEVRPGVDEATRRLQTELAAFRNGIKAVQDRANDQLQTYRQQFHRALEPLLERSVQGVSHSTDSWAVIHWATLKATIQRDGCFRSPTTGRAYDFNEDLATPLLDQLPVSWEKYFTDDLGRVVNDFVLNVKSEGKNFCKSASLVVELLLHKRDERMASQLAWFE